MWLIQVANDCAKVINCCYPEKYIKQNELQNGIKRNWRKKKNKRLSDELSKKQDLLIECNKLDGKRYHHQDNKYKCHSYHFKDFFFFIQYIYWKFVSLSKEYAVNILNLFSENFLDKF